MTPWERYLCRKLWWSGFGLGQIARAVGRTVADVEAVLFVTVK